MLSAHNKILITLLIISLIFIYTYFNIINPYLQNTELNIKVSTLNKNLFTLKHAMTKYNSLNRKMKNAPTLLQKHLKYNQTNTRESSIAHLLKKIKSLKLHLSFISQTSKQNHDTLHINITGTFSNTTSLLHQILISSPLFWLHSINMKAKAKHPTITSILILEAPHA